MKVSLLPCRRPFAAVLVAGFCLLAILPGCHRSHANVRPASVLTKDDRTLLDQYEQIRAALANDDLYAAQAAAKNMAVFVKPADAKARPPVILLTALGIVNAPALDRARQQFGTLSAILIPVAAGVEGFYVMTCPVPSAGDWIQQSTQVDDPYLGKAMHDYGEIKK